MISLFNLVSLNADFSIKIAVRPRKQFLKLSRIDQLRLIAINTKNLVFVERRELFNIRCPEHLWALVVWVLLLRWLEGNVAVLI